MDFLVIFLRVVFFFVVVFPEGFRDFADFDFACFFAAGM